MIHLHTHSMYSVLDGLGSVKDIVVKAKAIGAPAVAITDHASISAMPDLFKETKAAGIKPIIGCEFYVVDELEAENKKNEKRGHLTVWAKNWNGVLSIMKQLTIANSQFYKRPRLSWKQCFDFEDCVIGTACSSGVLGYNNYRERVFELSAWYGIENVMLEMMPYSIMEGDTDVYETINRRAVELSKEGFDTLATNDVHYVEKDDAHTHEILLAIQTGKTWDAPDRWRFRADGCYLRSRIETIQAFKALGYVDPDAITKAILGAYKLAARVNVEMPKFESSLPSVYGADDETMFQRLIVAGWTKKIPGKGLDEKAYGARLVYEVGVVKALGFAKYFLIVEDIIRWARSRGIMVGPARGSSAGSLLCYLLDITQIDPIRHGLYFERFLNPERIDLPDIDVDFQDDRRDEVFAYIRGKYGADCTANINTFGALSVKSAFRDVCRVFGINPIQVNVLSKQIEDADSFDKIPELVSFAKQHPNIVVQAKKLIGTIRQQGIHACGYVVSSRPLKDIAVIEKRKDAEVVNLDGKGCEQFGLLKIDILGLSTLTILNMAKVLVKENRGIDIEFTEIPLDDPETLAAFARGETVGAFQFENSGMQNLLKGIQANTFEMITASTALFRPGSLNSGQTATYVKIAKGDEYETYPCEQLKPILGPTKGVMVYQEQIMQIFNQLGGFSWAEADKMRKIIGKKLGKDEFEKHREHFSTGCSENGIDAGVATGLFDKMVEFASYSFNKSHAVAYTAISFWTMYLKTHFPLEFMTAQLSYTADDKIQIQVREALRLGLNVNNPDINIAGRKFAADLTDCSIIAPLGIVKGVGSKAVDAILEAREGGVFLSVDDFKARVNKRVVNIRVQELLIRAGCFENLGIVEADEAKRAKDFAELLPIYDALPSLTKIGKPIDKTGFSALLCTLDDCAKGHSKLTMPPKVLGASPVVMVINNPVKGELEHLTNDGTKFLIKTLKSMGLPQSMIYYTAPLKCHFPKIADAPKACQSKCMDYLRKEIELVKPKLILCFAANAMGIFGDFDMMSKANGQVVYSKAFDTYVLYAYSPQYAYFSDDKQEDFVKNMETAKEMFS